MIKELLYIGAGGFQGCVLHYLVSVATGSVIQGIVAVAQGYWLKIINK